MEQTDRVIPGEVGVGLNVKEEAFQRFPPRCRVLLGPQEPSPPGVRAANVVVGEDHRNSQPRSRWWGWITGQ